MEVWPGSVVRVGVKPFGAGPATRSPVEMSNWLPWHGQSMRPSATFVTGHPWWGHVVSNALKVPALGCVTTVFVSV